MLKACWDCLAGEAQRSTEDRYGVHMNGNSNTTPWQTSTQYGKMFAIPTQLKENDEIIIKGNLTDGVLDIGLRPNSTDQSNIVCQLSVNHPEDVSRNRIVLRNVVNGTNNTIGEYTASSYFNDETFEVIFIIMSGAIRVILGQSELNDQPLQHTTDDIRYISINGNVANLSFKFN